MAVLGKIRSRGALLMGIIGLGIFAFIAGEAVRSCESTRNNARQQVGEVLGEKIDVNDFQKLVDEYSEVIKMQQGAEALNDEQLNQVKDMVWNTFVQTKIVENEAEKLGLRVTDTEMQNVLKDGTNPMLLQTPFVNQQTGRFDASALQKFLAEYNTQKSANPQMARQYESIYNTGHLLKKHFVSNFLHRNIRVCLRIAFCQIPWKQRWLSTKRTRKIKLNLRLSLIVPFKMTRFR